MDAALAGASTRVLEKTGFAYDGEVAEDGEVVWRYGIRRGKTPPP
jgi:hypothetical protein